MILTFLTALALRHTPKLLFGAFLRPYMVSAGRFVLALLLSWLFPNISLNLLTFVSIAYAVCFIMLDSADYVIRNRLPFYKPKVIINVYAMFTVIYLLTDYTIANIVSNVLVRVIDFIILRNTGFLCNMFVFLIVRYLYTFGIRKLIQYVWMKTITFENIDYCFTKICDIYYYIWFKMLNLYVYIYDLVLELKPEPELLKYFKGDKNKIWDNFMEHLKWKDHHKIFIVPELVFFMKTKTRLNHLNPDEIVVKQGCFREKKPDHIEGIKLDGAYEEIPKRQINAPHPKLMPEAERDKRNKKYLVERPERAPRKTATKLPTVSYSSYVQPTVVTPYVVKPTVLNTPVVQPTVETVQNTQVIQPTVIKTVITPAEQAKIIDNSPKVNPPGTNKTVVQQAKPVVVSPKHYMKKYDIFFQRLTFISVVLSKKKKFMLLFSTLDCKGIIDDFDDFNFPNTCICDSIRYINGNGKEINKDFDTNKKFYVIVNLGFKTPEKLLPEHRRDKYGHIEYSREADYDYYDGYFKTDDKYQYVIDYAAGGLDDPIPDTLDDSIASSSESAETPTLIEESVPTWN